MAKAGTEKHRKDKSETTPALTTALKGMLLYVSVFYVYVYLLFVQQTHLHLNYTQLLQQQTIHHKHPTQ